MLLPSATSVFLFLQIIWLADGLTFNSYRHRKLAKRELDTIEYEKWLWESTFRKLQKRTLDSYDSSSTLSAHQFQECGTNILFVVDSTGSVRDYFENHRQYLLRVINRLEVIGNDGTCIGLIVYSSQLRKKIVTTFEHCKNREEITKIVENLPFFSGITATGSALELSYKAVETRRSTTPTNVVVITDGFSYDEVGKPAELLQRLPNVRTFAVTVTQKWRDDELATIAGSRDRVFVGMDSADRLATSLSSCKKSLQKNVVPEQPYYAPPPKSNDAFLESMEQKTSFATTPSTTLSYTPEHFFFNQRGEPCSCYPTCSQRTLDLLRKGELSYPEGMSTPAYYTSKGYHFYPRTTTPAAPVVTTVSTTTRAPATVPYSNYVVYTTSTPRPPPQISVQDNENLVMSYKQNTQGCMLDLMIVLDASGSLRERFQRQIDLIIHLIDRLKIGPDDTRIALVKYAGPRKARLVFDFDRYATKEDLKDAFRRVRFVGGTTYTNEALLKAEQELSRLNGQHSFGTSVVVVFTDGYSHESPEQGASLLRQRGVAVYAVGINHLFPVNREELMTIAGDNSRIFSDSESEQFEAEIEQMSRSCIRK